jgi:hypothetical protein
MKKTTIQSTPTSPPLDGSVSLPAWADTTPIPIDHFRPESSNHRPKATVRLLYSPDGLHLLFEVHDQHVSSTVTELNGSVCRDSCVEAFIRPASDRGYINFEINAGGTLHASFVEDWTRSNGNGFARYTPFDVDTAELVGIFHSMPKVVSPPIAEPTYWTNQVFIPFEVFSRFLGDVRPTPGDIWHANFYKCGGDPAYPHWAAWSPVRELNFHDPSCFGELHFGSA